MRVGKGEGRVVAGNKDREMGEEKETLAKIDVEICA